MTNYKISKINRINSKAYGTQLVLVDGGKYKDMIAGRMMKENGRGSWMVYAGTDRDYAEQVTAEHKVSEKSGGRTVQVWRQKHSHADNHYLDAEVYAFAAAEMLDVRTLHLRTDEEHPKPKQEAPQNENPGMFPEENWIRNNEGWI